MQNDQTKGGIEYSLIPPSINKSHQALLRIHLRIAECH